MTNGHAIGSLRLLRPIGTGGMGEVWLARDEALGVDRAVKFLLAKRAGDAALRARFAAEARTLAALGDMPGVVRVHAAGEDPATRRPFFVMDAHLLAPDEVRAVCTRKLGLPVAAAEAIVRATFESHAEFAESESHAESAERSFTLQDALGDEAAGTARQIPERAVLSLAREIAAALASLHGRKPPVVHRDLKPSNLLFAADGRLLLADFGVAKTLDASRPGLTLHGFQPGTQRYAAPELLRGDPATPAADWYALGVVLFRALTSSFPQWGESFPTNAGLRPRSPLWEPLLRDLRAPDPARRLADNTAFSRRLDMLEKALDTQKRPARRTKGIALAAAVAAVVAAGGAALLLHHADSVEDVSHAENAEDVSHAENAEDESHAETAEGAEDESHAETAEGAEIPKGGGGSGEAEPPPVTAHAADRGMTMTDIYSEARFPGQSARRGRIVSGMPSELDTSRYPDGPGPPPQEVDPAPIREFLPDLEREVETAINNLVSPWNKRSDYAVAEMQYRESYARQMLKSAESFRKRAEAGETIPDIDFFYAHFSREHWEAWLARRRAEESAARKIPPAALLGAGVAARLPSPVSRLESHAESAEASLGEAGLRLESAESGDDILDAVREFLPAVDRIVEEHGMLLPDWNLPFSQLEVNYAARKYRLLYAQRALDRAERLRRKAEAGEALSDSDFSQGIVTRDTWETWLARRRAEEADSRKIPPSSPETKAKESER